MSKDETAAGCVAGAIAIPCWCCGTVMWGYALSVIWGWHVAPAFGVQALNWRAATGVVLCAGLLRGWRTPDQEDTREESTKIIHSVGMLVAPWFSVFVAWVIK